MNEGENIARAWVRLSDTQLTEKTETELEKKKNKSFETDLFNALIKNRKKISTL